MKTASWEQIKTLLGFTGKTVTKAQQVADEALKSAKKADNTASEASKKVAGKMEADNPTGTGAFSMGRKEGSEIGENSHAEGKNTIASDACSHAEGEGTEASGYHCHAEGYETKAEVSASHAEGHRTVAGMNAAHAEGMGTKAESPYSHVEGYETKTVYNAPAAHAEGHQSVVLEEGNTDGDYQFSLGAHAEGWMTKASGKGAHSEGSLTTARGEAQHVQGIANIADDENKYAHIVGNGTYKWVDGKQKVDKASNAHTLDWDGNAWYAGTVEGTAMILKSPNGTRYKVTVNDSGSLTATAL
jgi:hypothetical protein